MRRTPMKLAAVAAVGVLALSACGERPTEGGSGSGSGSNEAGSEPSELASASVEPLPEGQFPDFKACMVSDSGGFDDKSFNQTSRAGLTEVEDKLGIQAATIESNSDSEYDSNVRRLVNQGCDEITTVGYKLGEATQKAAEANPKVDFAIVDFAYLNDAGKNVAPKNVKGLTFATAEPSYLAGYLAASQSESGVVGTFGGAQIPTVTIFMDGFVQGVERYNQDNDAQVQVLGWDPEAQEGSFTNDFENKSRGQSIANTLIQQGADVIFPVAGPAGLGGLQAAKDRDARAIWVDTDGCESAAEFCDVLLTSVMKGMDVAVRNAIADSITGDFTNEPYEGTLENGGVGLAPYHEFDGSIDQEVKDKIEQMKSDFISGELTLE
ncbi:BMP family lipoprotein [Nocardioides rotundus]|uniref:BMP family lipoprotein n=1 Tax=Nocardioides rotundus TaxID=1774216 RepID=UPI001CBCBC45|nr:BMP family ABC transporter substrate-binding protein [Nocardioides rotundus]